MERLVEVEATQHRTIFEEMEIFYPMTGFRVHLLVEHLTDGILPLRRARAGVMEPSMHSPPTASLKRLV
jgi:hypothetical protein